MRQEMIRIYQGPIPAGWKEAELRSLVDLKRGYSWSKDQEILKPEPGAVPVIRILNVQEKLLLNPLLYLRGLSEQDVIANAVSKGWILFVASNGNEDRIGDSVLIEEDMQMVFASFLMAMKPKNTTELLPEFLALWLRLHWVHEILSKTAQKGSGLGNFSWGAVRRLPLRYPENLDEQRRIVEAVAAVSRYVELTSARSPNIRTLKKKDTLQDAGDAELDSDDASDDEGTGECINNAAELEMAVALRFCLLEELVSGQRLLATDSELTPEVVNA
jgi:hypothetical protein